MISTRRIKRMVTSVDSPARPLPPVRVKLLVASAGVAGSLLLAACGGNATAALNGAPNSSSATASVTANTAAPTAATSASAGGSSSAATGSGAAGGAASATVKVSANRASRAELQRAFEAAGIPNAARWAMEVEEYRPYPTNDPSWAKLRRELAKYNIAPATLEQIIATLSLD